MIEWVGYLRTSINLYYIIPGVFALVVFWVQFSERNTKIMPLFLQISGIFSFILSIEYSAIILLLDRPLPAPLSTFDKGLAGVALIIILLIGFHYSTEGTKLGNWLSNILDNHISWRVPVPVPVSLLDEQLEKLREVREAINTGEESQLEPACQTVLESCAGVSILLQEVTHRRGEEIKLSIEKCKHEFQELSSFPSLQQRRKSSNSLSDLIGVLNATTRILDTPDMTKPN
ncbi:hypothetical protein BMS3Abin16_01894 [archaeon BMS3Abin16]|nr:hypothetical protein BMS3Abin16_01894 [archaeon BMS3Abin16]